MNVQQRTIHLHQQHADWGPSVAGSASTLCLTWRSAAAMAFRHSSRTASSTAGASLTEASAWLILLPSSCSTMLPAAPEGYLLSHCCSRSLAQSCNLQPSKGEWTGPRLLGHLYKILYVQSLLLFGARRQVRLQQKPLAFCMFTFFKRRLVYTSCNANVGFQAHVRPPALSQRLSRLMRQTADVKSTSCKKPSRQEASHESCKWCCCML